MENENTLKLDAQKRILRFQCKKNKDHIWGAQKKMRFCPDCGAEMICLNE